MILMATAARKRIIYHESDRSGGLCFNADVFLIVIYLTRGAKLALCLKLLVNK